MRHAVLEHPGIAGGGRDHLVDLPDVEALLGGERDRSTPDDAFETTLHLAGERAKDVPVWQAKTSGSCRTGLPACLRGTVRTRRRLANSNIASSDSSRLRPASRLRLYLVLLVIEAAFVAAIVWAVSR